MSAESVDTGIDVIGAAPWGTHFCQFYQTKEDLLDTLVPYFKAGLENNEFCMWITSEPLSAPEARKAIGRAMPDFADRLAKGQIEILPHTRWYLKGGRFDQQRVLDGWVDKLNAALASGYAGLRLSGNTFWLEKRDWKSFTDYEAAVNDVIGKYRMLALCTYSLDKCGATEVMDVIRNHEFALTRTEGNWELIENAIHKQMKQALIDSESRHRQLVESLQEGVWVIDKEAKTTFVNPRMAEMLGYSVEEMLGRHLLSFVDESRLDTARERMERRRQGVKEQVEFEFRRKDGGLLQAIVSAAPLTDSLGAFSGVIAGIVDVTERKRFEEALLQSEERYRTIVETSQEGIAIGLPDGRFAFVNQRMADMLGYAREELLGRTGLDFMDEDQKNIVMSSRRRLEEGQVIHAEYQFRRKDGSAMWTLCSASGMYDKAGRHLGNLAMHSDITERKKAEETLRESEDRLKRSEEIAHVGTWELDLLNNRLTWSDEVYRIFGSQPQEFAATYEAFLQAVHPEDRAAVNAAYLDSIRGGKDSYEIEHRVVRRSDGAVRFVHEKCEHLRDEAGEIVRSLGMVHDITERKRAEEAILRLNDDLRQRAVELGTANKELEAFAYSVSHDLRAPLRSIDGFSLALLEDYADKLDDDGKDYLRRVRKASQLMGRLIDDLLELSRVGLSDMHPKRVNLSQLAGEVTEGLQAAAPKRHGEFIIAPDISGYGDAPLLRAALENLLGNAWKFTGKRRRPRIEFGVRNEAGQQVYFVRDNGVGFDMTYAHKLFVPFQRLHVKEDFPGTGIGLATVKRIITRHGGRIWADGKVGTGATFYFTLNDHNERRENE